ncbi:MAG: nitrogen regulation protein NR(II) [Betaproteobacteria bacterium]|nr:nitrogen regulation protein NR(II) [Betaproteobacteria bacterium]
MFAAALPGLDLLATAVMLVDHDCNIMYANPAAENLLELSARQLRGRSLTELFSGAERLIAAMNYARDHGASSTEHDLELGIGNHVALHASCCATPVEDGAARALLLEFRPIDQRMKVDREERLLNQNLANRELIRNLAHEIKNPLGGIRGSAQLLQAELPRPQLAEYTQVIISEADRLQSLMDRLLTPHRLPQPRTFSVHEALERVRGLVAAETPEGIIVERDYDVSLPPIVADIEQIIQALLNIVRNAVQAMQGCGRIVLRTRVVRQAIIARRRYRHAARVEIVDSGPGIPDAIRDKLFFPLVSGRDGGTGLGLSIAQTYITQYGGTIEFESRPGRTSFIIHLPIAEPANGKSLPDESSDRP